jgi:hypothetical protein
MTYDDLKVGAAYEVTWGEGMAFNSSREFVGKTERFIIESKVKGSYVDYLEATERDYQENTSKVDLHRKYFRGATIRRILWRKEWERV